MKVILLAYLVMSVITICAYAIDKYKAKKAMWRTPEKTLHLLELCCGWPGAMLAQMLIRHKSKKLSFRLVFWLMVLANVSAVVFVVHYKA